MMSHEVRVHLENQLARARRNADTDQVRRLVAILMTSADFIRARGRHRFGDR